MFRRLILGREVLGTQQGGASKYGDQEGENREKEFGTRC